MILFPSNDERREIALTLVEARLNGLLAEMLQIDDGEGDADDVLAVVHRIPVPDCEWSTLMRLRDYCRRRARDPARPIPAPVIAPIEKWIDEDDAEMLSEMDNKELIAMMNLANYMHNASLVELLGAKIACEVKGFTPKEIREKFNITEKYTHEDEQFVRNNTIWKDTPVPR